MQYGVESEIYVANCWSRTCQDSPSFDFVRETVTLGRDNLSDRAVGSISQLHQLVELSLCKGVLIQLETILPTRQPSLWWGCRCSLIFKLVLLLNHKDSTKVTRKGLRTLSRLQLTDLSIGIAVSDMKAETSMAIRRHSWLHAGSPLSRDCITNKISRVWRGCLHWQIISQVWKDWTSATRGSQGWSAPSGNSRTSSLLSQVVINQRSESWDKGMDNRWAGQTAEKTPAL